LLTINTAQFVPNDLPGGAITITTNPSPPAGEDIVTVTVNVSWTGPKNMPRQLEVTSMRSRF